MAMDPRDGGLGFLKEAWDKLAHSYSSPGDVSQETWNSLGEINQEVFYSPEEALVNQEVANQAMPLSIKSTGFDILFDYRGSLRKDLVHDLINRGDYTHRYIYHSENWCGDNYCFQGNPEKNAAFYYMLHSIFRKKGVRIVLTARCKVVQKDLAFLFFDSQGRLRRKELDFFMKPLSAGGNFLDYLPDYREDFEEEDAKFLLAIYLCMVDDSLNKADELGIHIWDDADGSIAAYLLPGMRCKAGYKS